MYKIAIIGALLASSIVVDASGVTALANPLPQPIDRSVQIDVFTTSTRSVVLPVSREGHDTIAITVHTLDPIERFTHSLSRNLSPDPDRAKDQVMQRLKAVNATQQAALQQTGEALALAIRIGLTRYPAIVFNSQWVVYGITDVPRAIALFDRWQQQGEQ